MTNREKINQMSDEGMAEYIADMEDSDLYANIIDDYCLNLCPHRNTFKKDTGGNVRKVCDYGDEEYAPCPEIKETILIWLRSEATS